MVVIALPPVRTVVSTLWTDRPVAHTAYHFVGTISTHHIAAAATSPLNRIWRFKNVFAAFAYPGSDGSGEVILFRRPLDLESRLSDFHVSCRDPDLIDIVPQVGIGSARIVEDPRRFFEFHKEPPLFSFEFPP